MPSFNDELTLYKKDTGKVKHSSGWQQRLFLANRVNIVKEDLGQLY